ncbi:MAG: SMP-30/gluconolactonase/LRE family protein [Betaproteobacteria bacterium]|nr:SMP-30/gluconolactonase/LRE family protein [Betaproteobacteria bacterium]
MEREQLPFDVVAAAGHILAESGVWCARTQRLWWVDIRAPQVKRWDSGSGAISAWTMPELAGAVVLVDDGRVAVALQGSIHLLDPNDGSLTTVLTLEHGMPHNRLNEAKCDLQGRLWCGSMWDFGAQAAGSLYRIDRDLRATRVRADVTIPNGIAFSPEGRQMYFVDTPKGTIEVASYDTGSGQPGSWSTLVEAGLAPGKPDGSTVDSDGCIWNARYGAGCVARFRPNGELDRLIALPVTQPTSCTFGGAGLDTLFITSAAQRMDAAALAAEPLAGAVLALRPGARGLPETAFTG